jgi:hypothetical protein
MNRALMEFYDNCLISLNMPHEWPPRSCDLTSCDFSHNPIISNSHHTHLSTYFCTIIFQHRNIHSELLIHSSLLAMICRRSSISTTGALKIEFLMYGYKKKSHGVRSQNVGGHSCGIFKLIRWLS